jgi:hypothetical protein
MIFVHNAGTSKVYLEMTLPLRPGPNVADDGMGRIYCVFQNHRS